MDVFFIIVLPFIIFGSLVFILIGPFKKSGPVITQLTEPIKMIGVKRRTGMKTIYKDAAKLGKEYKKVKDQNLIQNKKEPWAFVAISKDFEGLENWEYLMGDVVNDFNVIPKGLQSFEIPPGLYAVFAIKPKSKFAWGMEIGRTKKYVYDEWFPDSGYKLNDSILTEFEYHDKRSLEKNPRIDLYVSIKK
jgi:predicted transcriptional regulator YdeE